MRPGGLAERQGTREQGSEGTRRRGKASGNEGLRDGGSGSFGLGLGGRVVSARACCSLWIAAAAERSFESAPIIGIGAP